MGNIVLMMSVSADGFIEGPDRDIGWHRVDDELHQHFNDVLGAMGAFLSGRVTYELMAGFWPTADADPDSTPPMVEFAGIWRDTPKVVYSRTLERAGWNTTIVREVDPAEVRRLAAAADGFIEGPDRDIGWHLVDDEVHQHFNDVLGAMGAFLSGRVTYELLAGFWPTADADPASTPRMVEFAGIWRDTPKVVYSRTLERADWNTTIVREVGPEEVRRLAARTEGDLALGGADLAAAFRRHDLIDEYRVYVHPVIIGRGKPLFEPVDTRTDLRLVATRTFGNGVVLLHHRRA